MTSFEIESTVEPKLKTPKRVLHFSDGVLEEYSSDESDEFDNIPEKINPSSLTWGPWCIFYMGQAATKTLAFADFCGERLAWFFGITQPKYITAINEFERKQKEIELDRLKDKKLEEEMQGISSIDVQVVGDKKYKGLKHETYNDDEEKY